MVIMKVEIKRRELVIWKTRKITCISYLEMKRARVLVHLQSEGVMRVSYLKPEKRHAFLKSTECVSSRKGDAHRSKVPS